MDPHPTSVRSPRRWLGFLALFVALLLASGWWFYFHDEPPPNDADLRLTTKPVPDAQNGMVQLAKLPTATVDFITYAKTHGVIDESTIYHILNGQTRQDPLVDAFLAQAAPVFNQFDAVLALPYFQNAADISLKIKFPETEAAISVASALRLAVLRSMQKGDYGTAVRDTLRLRLLASRMTESYAYLYQYLKANIIYGYSAQSARDLLNAPDLPNLQLVTLAHAYSVNEPAMAAFQRTLTMEYQFSLAALAAEATTDALYQPKSADGNWGDKLGAYWLHYTLKPNTTHHQLASFYRDWRATVNGPYAGIDFAALNARRLSMQQHGGTLALVSWVLAPNTGGRYFLAISAGSPDILKYPYWAVATDRLLRTGFALRLYYLDHGTFPRTLAELVPQYLPHLPQRPFDGAPFHYDANRGRIYSIGTSAKDTGGSQFAGVAPNSPHYIDPLMDTAQPTLVLTFQKQNLPPLMDAPATLPEAK